MELNAVLCNHAEVQNNLLYVAGGGIDRSFVDPRPGGPWAVSVAIAMTVEVPWTQTDRAHTVAVGLIDADGRAVEVPVDGGRTQPLRVELTFTLGRPPELGAGESQVISLAVPLTGLPLPSLGTRWFVLSVDGVELTRLRHSLVPRP